MKKLLLLFTLLSLTVFSQVNRETRAVWVTTNFRLDWPPSSYDAQVQKTELRKIFDDIKAKRLNTVYFQVRSNGTVMFHSSYEALSPYITGQMDGNSSYDPLSYAIELAHDRGLEIHAWVNVVRCFSGGETEVYDHPYHIAQRRPDWVIKNERDGTSYWLDMGLPEVRQYLISIFAELVDNYNVDGLHLDFIRYPGKDFNDAFSYNLYGKGLSVDDWRRQNINTFVKNLSLSIKKIKPFLKLGAAPLGIYKNSSIANGFEGYGEVYQDSREWLKQKYVDYLVPQIYWPIEGPPRFDELAEEWSSQNFDRSIVLGIAAYKPEVKNQIKEIVEFSRNTNADGFSFFRYSNIADLNFYRIFSKVALPADMAWIDSDRPLAPINLTYNYDSVDPNIITLDWSAAASSNALDSTSYFALYSLPNRNADLQGDNLFEVVSADKTSLKLAIDKPKRINYYFTLKSLNKLWKESIESSNIVEVTFRELSLAADMNAIFESPVLIKEKGSEPKILLFSGVSDQVEIRDSKNSLIKESQIYPGKNILSLNTEDISSLTLYYKSSGKEIKLKN